MSAPQIAHPRRVESRLQATMAFDDEQGGSAVTLEFYRPSISDEHLEGLHDFLIARGWEADGYMGVDDRGCPADPESTWRYPESYSSVTFREHGEISPSSLSGHFSFERGLSVVIYSAGNISGCTEHDMAQYEIDLLDGRLDLDRLAELHTELEPAARALDPRALIEFRFFGACGTR